MAENKSAADIQKQIDQSIDPLVSEVVGKVTALEAESQRRYRGHLEDKNHILLQHWGKNPVGDEEHIVTSYSTAIDFKFAAYLGGSGIPDIIVKKHLPQIGQNPTPAELQQADQISRAVAQGVEKIMYKVFRDNDIARKLYYHAIDMAMLGTGFLYYHWDTKDKTGSPKGTAKIDNISPMRVRVAFSSTDWTEIDYWAQITRITPAKAKEMFNIDVEGEADQTDKVNATSSTDTNYNSPTSSVWSANANAQEPPKTLIPMVDLIIFHDNNKDITICGNKVVNKDIHKKGYHGLVLDRFYTVPNEPFGFPAHFVVRDLVLKLDLVDSKIMEILKAHAAPLIIDKGNVMGGKPIPARSNTVITTRPWNAQAGEGIEAILPATNIGHLLNYRSTIIKSIHDLSQMPESAFGTYQPGTRSGFAMTIQMQPTLQQLKAIQNSELKPGLRKIGKWILKDLQRMKAADLPKGTEDLDIDFHFSDPLPKDDAREIQNQVLLVTNKIVSRYMARETLGIEDVADEALRIAQEANNVAENPEQALKIQEFQLQQAEKEQAAQSGPVKPSPKINISLRSDLPADTALDIAANEGLITPQQEKEAEPLVENLATAAITEPGFGQGRQVEIGQPEAGVTTGPEANGLPSRPLNPGENLSNQAPQDVAPEQGPQQVLPQSVAPTSKV